MKVCHILFCFIFLYLQDGSSALINDETLVHGVEGGNITVQCKFILTGFKIMFCKEKCEKGNVLIETTKIKTQSSRYSIELLKYSLSEIIVNVSITQLKKSDSGWYRCTMERIVQESYDDFKIVVTEASDTSTPDFKPQPFTPSASPEIITKPSGSGFSLHLVIRVTVVVVFFLLSVLLLLIYRNKAESSCGLNRRRNSNHNQMEIGLNEIDNPVSTCEDSTYQSLNPASRDHDQTYSTLRHNDSFQTL